jgi:hypothetical protein
MGYGEFKRIMEKMKRILIVLLLLGGVAVCSLAETDVEKDPPEYRIKGVFLNRFADFIDWPLHSDTNNKSTPFVIGIIGENPFGNWLNILYNKKKIREKKVEIWFISNPKDILGCNLLFISETEKKNLNEIVSIADKNQTLTVGDTAGFAKKGVHINFYVEQGNMKFEVNETAIRESGFRVSYHMLKLARIINPWEERE